MNILVGTSLNDCKQKMGGYHTLLVLRYANLCVKSDPLSIIPVSIDQFGESKHLEDVAHLVQPNEYQLEVYPKEKGYMQDIISGVFGVHPEFKLEIKKVEGTTDEDDLKYLIYTMPEVDKNRRDVLIEGVKTFHDECKMRIDEVYAQGKTDLLSVLKSGSKEEIDEANDALERMHDQFVETVRELRDDKIDEIEDAYMKYEAEHAGASDNADNPGYDVVSGFRLPVE